MLLVTVLVFRYVLFLFLCIGVFASKPALAANDVVELCGEVVHQEDDTPVASALIRINEDEHSAVTNQEGTFCVSLEPGVYHVDMEHLGMTAATKTVELDEQRKEITLYVHFSELWLDEVNVTASVGSLEGEEGSVTRIERSAIRHLQASSLADILQLVPGQLADNPTLDGPRQSLIRQLPTTSDVQRANALGTSLVMDGMPASNNANLQTDNRPLNFSPGSLPSFSSVAGRGSDLRKTPADLIESVEVVRGIPSARHGDLTTGALLVETRGGAMPPELRFRSNPNLLEGGFSVGFGDGRESAGVSLNSQITASQDDPREVLDNFYRYNGQITYSQPWLTDNRMLTTLRVSGWSTLDEEVPDPDDTRYRRERSSTDRALRVNLSGRYDFQNEESRRLSWNLGTHFGYQEGYYSERVNRTGLFPLSDATIDTTQEGFFGPSEYITETTVEGRPVNIYGRLEYRRRWQIGEWFNVTTAGSEYRFDENRGAGRQFDPLRPPRQNYSVGERPRSFDDVPSLTSVAAYLDNRMYTQIADRTFSLHTGLRFDNIEPESPLEGRFGTVISPRINISAEVIPNLQLIGGLGRTAKAPPLTFLYPNPQYFDVTNFSNYATDPAERKVIITTRKVEPDNSGMTAYTTDKAETGIAWQGEEFEATITGFAEITTGAYGYTRFAEPIEVDQFSAVENPDGEQPVLRDEPDTTTVFLGGYDAPVNSRSTENLGVEFTFDFPQLDFLNTDISLDGAYIRTESTDEGEQIDTDFVFRSSDPPERIGIYDQEKRWRDRLSSSVRFVHHVPDVGLVISWLAQTVWWDRDEPRDIPVYPVAYLDQEGHRHELSVDEARSQEYEELHRSYSDDYGLREARPPLWLFNVRLSKVFDNGIEASLYVNNFFSHRPLYERARGDSFQQRNPPLFFGFDLSIQLQNLNLWQ